MCGEFDWKHVDCCGWRRNLLEGIRECVWKKRMGLDLWRNGRGVWRKEVWCGCGGVNSGGVNSGEGGEVGVVSKGVWRRVEESYSWLCCVVNVPMEELRFKFQFQMLDFNLLGSCSFSYHIYICMQQHPMDIINLISRFNWNSNLLTT